jgi:hypothetical protein
MTGSTYSGSIAEFVDGLRSVPILTSSLDNPSFEENALADSSDYTSEVPEPWIWNETGTVGIIGEARSQVVDTPYGTAWIDLQGVGSAIGQAFGDMSLTEAMISLNYVISRCNDETTATDHSVKIIAGSSETFVGGVTLAEYTYNTPLSSTDEYDFVTADIAMSGSPGSNNTLWLVFENGISDGTGGQLLIDAVSFFATIPSPIVAEFTDGYGSILPDQYPGVAGDGWSGGWVSSGVTATLIDTNPVNAGGNYLSMTDINGGDGVGRSFSSVDSNGSTIDTSLPYVIQFDYRIDALPNIGQNNIDPDGRLQILGRDTMQANTDASNTFIIFASSNYAGDGTGTTPVWQFHDGEKDGNWYGCSSSGLEVHEGHVYHFAIAIDPANLEWSIMIDDHNDSASPTTMKGLGFRRSSFLTEPYTIFSSQAETSGTAAISIDNFRVAKRSAGDLTADGKVDMVDMAELSREWQMSYWMDTLVEIAEDWLK